MGDLWVPGIGPVSNYDNLLVQGLSNESGEHFGIFDSLLYFSATVMIISHGLQTHPEPIFRTTTRFCFLVDAFFLFSLFLLLLDMR